MDPVTITLMALQAVGKLIGGLSAYSSGKAVERQMKYRAEQANQQASVQANVALDQADRVGGEAAVDAAANGGGLDGSSQDVLGDIQRRGTFNARSAIWAGETQANNARYQGIVARRQGALKLIGGTVDSGSSLASIFAPSGGGASAASGA